MSIRAGKLRHKLIIEQFTEVIDSYGDRVETWTTYAIVRGSLEPLTGREFFVAQQYESEVSAKAMIRYCAGVDTKMRVRHDDLLYNIVFVQDHELKHRYMTLMLTEGLRD